MIYSCALIKLTSRTFSPFSALKINSQKESSFLPEKKAIHLFHTSSSFHIPLPQPKAFKDAQHLILELVQCVHSAVIYLKEMSLSDQIELLKVPG